MSQSSATGTPRWVKVFVIITLVLVLLVVAMLVTGLGGEHGPGRHIPSADPAGTPSAGAGGQTPPIEHGMQQPDP